MLVCVATLWAFFFGLNWLSSYDEDDIFGTYTLMVQKADNDYVPVPPEISYRPDNILFFRQYTWRWSLLWD
jgi:hypothetical protein